MGQSFEVHIHGALLSGIFSLLAPLFAIGGLSGGKSIRQGQMRPP